MPAASVPTEAFCPTRTLARTVLLYRAMRALLCLLTLAVVGCTVPKPATIPASQSYGLGWESPTPDMGK